MTSHIDKIMANSLLGKSPFKKGFNFGSNNTSSAGNTPDDVDSVMEDGSVRDSKNGNDASANAMASSTPQSSECSKNNTNKLPPADDSAGTTIEGEAAKDTEMVTSSASAFESSTHSSSLSGKEIDASMAGDGGGSRVLLEGTSDVLDRSLHTISDEETMDTSGKENNVNVDAASIPTHMDTDDNTRGDEKNGEEKRMNGSSCSGKSMSYEHSGSNLTRGSNSERSLVSNTKSSVPKWSDVLATPSDNAAYTPSTDVSNMKENLHGIGKCYLS